MLYSLNLLLKLGSLELSLLEIFFKNGTLMLLDGNLVVETLDVLEYFLHSTQVHVLCVVLSQQLFSLEHELCLDGTFLFSKLFAHLNLAPFYLLVLLVTGSLVILKCNLVKFLLIFKLKSLLDLLLRVLEDEGRVKLTLALSFLRFDLDLVTSCVNLCLGRLAQSLTASLVFLPILHLHLFKFCALLLQSLIEFVLDLEHLGFFLLLECALVVIEIGAHLLCMLIKAPLRVFLSIFLHLSDICG